MGNRVAHTTLAALAVMGAAAQAQESGAQAPVNAPLSAIDWLSDSVTMPAPSGSAVAPLPRTDEPAVTDSAAIDTISVAPLGRPLPDAVGILPVSVTGLAADLWGPADAPEIARQIRATDTDLPPALLDLLYTLLLAEVNPPEGADAGSGHDVFLARVDKLLELGALDQADALLARAGPENPDIFRRWFDVSLLLGTENEMCAVLRKTPELSPTFTARVFCLARTGDWKAAVLTLGTGRALGFISPEEDALLARFLDPDLFEGEPPLPVPARPSPLEFRLFEAIGQPIQTAALPLAFAQSDLRANIGWKARIIAGERLARSGAVTANQLLGLYTERRAAASGGVWDRVAAVQALDHAYKARDAAAIAAALPDFWRQIKAVEVEVPMSNIFGPALGSFALEGAAAVLGLKLALLSDQFAQARTAQPVPELGLALAVARGQVAGFAARTPPEAAVIAGFEATGVPERARVLVEQGRIGEAILRAIALFQNGASGNLAELSDALALLRALGLEQPARRAALEFLLLERRG